MTRAVVRFIVLGLLSAGSLRKKPLGTLEQRVKFKAPGAFFSTFGVEKL